MISQSNVGRKIIPKVTAGVSTLLWLDFEFKIPIILKFENLNFYLNMYFI